MPLTALTNTGALQAQGNISKNADLAQQAMSRISSGSRIVKASDDTASAAINAKMGSLIAGLNQAISNTSQGASLLQVATGGLTNLADILTRQRVLATQVNNQALGQEERDFANLEFQQLVTQFDDIVDQTRFNGAGLLTGGGTITSDDGIVADAITRDATKVTTNTFNTTTPLNATNTTGAISGTVQSATVVENVTGGYDITAVIGTSKGAQTFTATSHTPVGGGTLDLTSATGNVLSLNYSASVAGLTDAGVFDTSLKQLFSITPGATPASFTTQSQGFSPTTGVAEVSANKFIAGGQYTLMFDSNVPTITATGAAVKGMTVSAAAPANTFAGTIAAASDGLFTGTVTSVNVGGTDGGPYTVSVVVEDAEGNSQTFQNLAAVAPVARATLVLTSTTSAAHIDLDYDASNVGGLTTVAQMQTALNQMLLNGGANAATFTNASEALVGGAADGIANITSTTALANGEYQLSYVGPKTAGAGNENLTLTLMDGTSQTITVLEATIHGAPTTYTFTTVGNGSVDVLFGTGLTDRDFTVGFIGSGSSANGPQLVLDNGRGTRETLNNAIPANNSVHTFASGVSVTLGSQFDTANDYQTTFNLSEKINFTFQVADKASDTITIDIDSVSAANVNIVGIDVTSIANAASALDRIAVALNEVNSVYATLGSQQKRLELAEANASTTVENLTAAKATFWDADLPAELTNRTIADVQYKASISMLTQANAMQLEILGAIR
jgi:flagellin